MDNTQIENTLNTIVEILNTLVAGQQNGAVNVTVDGGGFEFVGFSVTTIKPGPGVGFVGMHQVCQLDFNNPETRMCTDKEYTLSPNASRPVGRSAWIQLDGSYLNSNFGDCAKWTDMGSTRTGEIVTEGSGILGGSCSSARPITCCARVTQAP